MTQKSDGLIQVRDELFETYENELDLPPTVFTRADEILDNAVEENLTRSRCYKTIIAAVTFIASRENNVPRVAEDFGNATIKNGEPISQNDVLTEYRRIKREFSLPVKPITATAYLEYYLDELDATDETRDAAQHLLETAQSNGLANRPAATTLAAGALDAGRRLTGDDIVQTDIADVSHKSINQFRDYCQKIMANPTA